MRYYKDGDVVTLKRHTYKQNPSKNQLWEVTAVRLAGLSIRNLETFERIYVSYYEIEEDITND